MILYLGARGDIGADGIQQLGNAPEECRNGSQQMLSIGLSGRFYRLKSHYVEPPLKQLGHK